MARYILIPLLLMAISLQTFQRAFIVIGYYTNTASFAINCENKERPVLKCAGKCQMMKKMQEAEKKDAPSGERKAENWGDTIYYLHQISFKSLLTFATETPSHHRYVIGALSDPSANIDHPPTRI